VSQFFNDSDGIAVILSLDIGDNIKLRPSDGLGGRTTSSEVVAGAVLQRQSVSAKKLVDVYSRISCGGTSGGSSACGDFCGHESCGISPLSWFSPKTK